MRPLEAFLLAYFINALWQIPLLFAAAWIAARALRFAGPAVEHRIWVSALLLESLLPAIPSAPLAWLRGLWPSPAATGRGRVTVDLSPGTASGILHLPASLLSVIAIAFAACIIFFAMRLLWRTWRLSTLRRSSTPLPLSASLAPTWLDCSRTFHVPDAALATAPGIFGPITLGVRRRLVLLPESMLDRLAVADLRTVLAHEFAHMHRHDFLKNLLYELLTLPARFHPLLWLTREHVIETREMICDDLAAQSTSHTEYARSLLRLASLLVGTPAARTPHAIGILDAHTFERRLMKLTQTSLPIRGLRSTATAAACLVLGISTCTSALALHVGIGSDDSARNTSKTTPGAVRIPAGVLAGNIQTRVNPVYPATAKKDKIQGSVVLHAIIGKTGAVENLTVVSGPAELQTSALDAVHQWTYKPYLLNGEPVEVDTTITVNYQLNP